MKGCKGHPFPQISCFIHLCSERQFHFLPCVTLKKSTVRNLLGKLHIVRRPMGIIGKSRLQMSSLFSMASLERDDEYLEAEMMSFASQISLMNDVDINSLEWTEKDSLETHENIKLLEEIIRNANKELDGNSNSSLMRKSYFENATVSSTKGSKSDQLASISSTSSDGDLGSPATPSSPSMLAPRSRLSRKRSSEKTMSDIITSITEKLKSYKLKMVRNIQENPESDMCLVLVELNDTVEDVLSRAEFSMRTVNDCFDVFEEEDEDNDSMMEDNSHDKRSLSGDSHIELGSTSSNGGNGVHHNSNNNGGNGSLSGRRGPSMHSILYMLHRPCDRRETRNAVSQLIQKLYTNEGEAKIAAIHDMRANETLPILLSALPKCSEWPEVEIQITAAISVLVTYEDERPLLQRSALDILSALHLLQLKSASRVRTRYQTMLVEKSLGVKADDNNNNNINNNNIGDQDKQLAEDSLEFYEMRVLVSAALTKLTAVLCDEWMKLDSFHVPGIDYLKFLSLDPSNAGTVAPMSRHRSTSNGSRMDKNSAGGSVDFTHYMNTILHLIFNICGPADTTPRPPQSLTASPSNVSALKRNQSLSPSVPVSPPAASPLRLSQRFVLGNQPTTSNIAAVQSLPALLLPVDFIRSTSGVGANIGASEHNKQWEIPAFGEIDTVCVTCSLGLCFLAEVPQCRLGLISFGALQLLHKWLDAGTDILTQIALRCEEGELQARSRTESWMSPDSIDESDRTSAETADTKPAVSPTAAREKAAEFESFIAKCRLACDLINNVSAAIMYLLGGQPDNSQAPYRGGENTARMGKSGPQGQDYMVGWIDAQLMNEGIPAAIIKFVLKAIEAEESRILVKYLELSLQYDPSVEQLGCASSDKEKDKTGSTFSELKSLTLFSHAARINLSQALGQLCTRAQNRQQLAVLGTPLTLSALFVFVVSMTGANDDMSREENGPPCKDDKLTALRVRLSSMNKSPHSARSANWNQTLKEHGALLSHFPEYPCSDMAQVFFSGNNINSSRSMILVSTACLNALSAFLEDGLRTNRIYNTKPSTSTALVSSIAQATSSNSSSLNSIHTSSDLAASKGSGTIKVPAIEVTAAGTNSTYSFIASLASAEVAGKLGGNFLLECMCNLQMVESLKFLLAFLPRGRARLATLRVIKSLSETHRALDVLFSRDLTDALVLISSEAVELKRGGQEPVVVEELPSPKGRRSFDDTLKRNTIFSSSPTTRKTLSAFKPNTPRGGAVIHTPGSFPNTPVTPASTSSTGSGERVIVKPTAPVRSVSVGSVPLPEPRRPGSGSISKGRLSPILQGKVATPLSSTSSSMGGNNNLQHPRHVGIFGAPTDKPLYSLNIPSIPSSPASSSGTYGDIIGKVKRNVTSPFSNPREIEEIKEIVTPEMEIEETMTVCYILGNFCERNLAYAERVFDNGLLSIMLPLVKSRNVEIGRQALRCVSATCAVIAAAPTDRVGATRQQKSQLYKDTLVVLKNALLHSNSVMNKEAVTGIANLSPDPDLHNDIISGPFKNIVSLLIDRNCEAETIAAAENVLKNLGFTGAIGDLEICYYDSDVMIDWFNLRKALVPQMYARKLLRRWFAELFRNTRPSRKGAPGGGGPVDAELREKQRAMLKREDSEQGSSNDEYDCDEDVTKIGDESLDLTNDNRARRIPHTKSMNLVSEIQKHIGSREEGMGSFSQSPGVSRHYSDSNMSPYDHHDTPSSHLSSNGSHFSFFPHVHFADSFMKYLPFCIGKHAALEILRDEEAEARERESLDRSSPIFSMMSSLTTQPHNLPMARAALVSPDGPSSSSVKANPDPDNLFSLNEPPVGVVDLLHVFYPSKLHQLFFMDLTSLQNETVLMVTEEEMVAAMPSSYGSNSLFVNFHNSGAASASNLAAIVETVQKHLVKLPTPHAVSGIYFPPRQYSFERIKRVVERMVDEGGPDKRWSLAFRDDSFAIESMTDFYGSLVPMLCKCPQVVCLSVSNGSMSRDPNAANANLSAPIQTAHLGHMVGNVPPSIRFINLRGVLSSESIQALIILLRKQNFCFAKPVSAFDVATSQENNRISLLTAHKPRIFRKMALPTKGLLGLAITHTQFSSSDLQYLIDLLAVYHSQPTTRKRNSKSNTHFHGFGSEDVTTLRQKLVTGGCPRGIRYLDLSYDRLSETVCSDILRASSFGPLEGLDFTGNFIHKGTAFIETFAEVVSDSSVSFLRHICLSNTSLHWRAICSILDCLHNNCSLSSIDLSGNDLRHSDRTKESIRQFLKKNRGVRYLDFSNNKLTVETMKEVYLGILENETLLLFPLAHNLNVHQASEMPFIQEKLKDNRRRYSASVEMYNQTLKRIQKRSERVASAAATVMTTSETVADAPTTRKLSHPLEEELNTANLQSSSPVLSSTVIPQGEEGRPSDLTGPEPPLAVAVLVDDSSNPEYMTLESVKAAGNSSTSVPPPALTVPMATVESVELPSVVQSTPVSRPANLASDLLSPLSSDSNTQRPPLPPLSTDGNYDDSSTPITARSSRTKDPGSTSLASINEGVEKSSPGKPFDSNLNVLNVFFSAPLAWRDRSNKFHPLEMLDYTGERDSLIQVMREVHRDISIAFEFATTDSLRTALSFGCRALHFSGHGHPQCLNFEDGRAGLQLVTVDTLRSLLRAGGLKLDFVFVSACHSRKTGEAFVEAGVPHVVCVKVDAMIQDSAASAFTRAFYLALLSGKTVQESFDIAREALKASPYVPDSLLEGEKFVLLPDTSSHRSDTITHSVSVDSIVTNSEMDSPIDSGPDASVGFGSSLHDVPIFRSKPVAEWPMAGHIRMGSNNHINHANFSTRTEFETASDAGEQAHSTVPTKFFDGVVGASGSFFGSVNHTLPIPPPDFEGREVDMYRVITTLLSRRLVTLVGDVGVGKTSITAAICTYIADRTMFPDGVLYLRLSLVHSHCSFLSTVLRGLANGPPRVVSRLDFLSKSSKFYFDAMDSCCNPNFPGATNASPTSADQSSNNIIYSQEQLIVTCLSSLRMLIVFDQIDPLLSGTEEGATELKIFLGRLFDRCRHLKILVTGTETLATRHVSGFGVVENCVALGPLTLRSSIRLFARLAPPLISSALKTSFISALMPPKNSHVTSTSRDLTVCTSNLLKMVGDGHPALIVKLACASTQQSIQECISHARRIIRDSSPPPQTSPSPHLLTPAASSLHHNSFTFEKKPGHLESLESSQSTANVKNNTVAINTDSDSNVNEDNK